MSRADARLGGAVVKTGDNAGLAAAGPPGAACTPGGTVPALIMTRT
jgi:hypothetical protein